MNAALKILGIIFALALLGGVMAYLAGFFDEKIPIDLSRVVPAAGTGREFVVKITKDPQTNRQPARFAPKSKR